jgi:hypothetical protein
MGVYESSAGDTDFRRKFTSTTTTHEKLPAESKKPKVPGI